MKKSIAMKWCEALCCIDGDATFSTADVSLAKGVKFTMENSYWGADNYYRVYSVEEVK